MKIFKLWLLVVIWAGIIFWLSSIPNLKTSLSYDFVLRKLAHIIEYFILTFLLYRAFKGSFKISVFQLFIFPVSLSFFYAVFDEFHQSFVPGRNASAQDVVIDSIGILGFYIVIKIIALNKR